MARLESGRQMVARMGMMESGRQLGSLPVVYAGRFASASRKEFPRIPRVEHEDDYPLNEADVDPNWSPGRVKRENKRQQRKREDDFNLRSEDYRSEDDY